MINFKNALFPTSNHRNLKIYVPNTVLIINCVGKVIRIDKPRHTFMFGIAIKFTEIGEQEKELISKGR